MHRFAILANVIHKSNCVITITMHRFAILANVIHKFKIGAGTFKFCWPGILFHTVFTHVCFGVCVVFDKYGASTRDPTSHTMKPVYACLRNKCNSP